jgi:DNA (cytosine-5)-methyltransferase 1
MKTMHLFAGIGGGLLADLILGHEPVIAVEWDKYACRVLRERAADGWFPGLHVWEVDVRLFDPSEYAGKVDCIHAGFPCQDISVAGKQAGVSEGTRSGLYREVLRIAGIVRPRYLFLENVAAILSNGLGTVLADLAAMGYDCRWLCIRASDVGAPHHRDRFFLLAYTKGQRRICVDKSGKKRCAEVNIKSAREIWRLSCDIPVHVDWVFSDPDSGTIRNDDGLSEGVCELKGIGNGIVPLQAAAAWRLLGGDR